MNQRDQIWQNFATVVKLKKSGYNLKGVLSICASFEPTLATCLLFGEFVVNGQILNKQSSHLVTLVVVQTHQRSSVFENGLKFVSKASQI